MKTIIIIESAKELIDFANPTRIEGDTEPFLDGGQLIFDQEFLHVTLTATDKFELSPKVCPFEILKELARRCHLVAKFE
jgi:hypothetical protein